MFKLATLIFTLLLVGCSPSQPTFHSIHVKTLDGVERDYVKVTNFFIRNEDVNSITIRFDRNDVTTEMVVTEVRWI